MNEIPASIDWLRVAGILASITGAVISIVTFIKVVHEYIKQGKLKRAESFSSLEAQLWQNPAFRKISILITKDETEENTLELQHIDLQDKYAFLAFYEKIALMLNSELISEDIAHYMFGYIAIACYDNDAFWSDGELLDRKDPYWSLFSDFALRMKNVENTFSYSRSKLKF